LKELSAIFRVYECRKIGRSRDSVRTLRKIQNTEIHGSFPVANASISRAV
jgi:hypothetical protein